MKGYHQRKIRSSSHFNSNRGMAMAEVAMGGFLTAAIAAIGADLTIVALGFSNLDVTTRDCARAAAQQNTNTGATNAAISQLSVHATDGYFCQQPQLVGNAVVTYQDWSQSPYSGNAPTISGSSPSTTQCAYVTVKCQETVRLPVPAPFFGTNITNYAPGSVLTFYRTYTYPIVKIKYTGS